MVGPSTLDKKVIPIWTALKAADIVNPPKCTRFDDNIKYGYVVSEEDEEFHFLEQNRYHIFWKVISAMETQAEPSGRAF